MQVFLHQWLMAGYSKTSHACFGFFQLQSCLCSINTYRSGISLAGPHVHCQQSDNCVDVFTVTFNMLCAADN